MKALSLKPLLLLLFSAVSLAASGHNINYALENSSYPATLFYYFQPGFTHIFPFGPDHLLLVMALCLIRPDLPAVCRWLLYFSGAHCITQTLNLAGFVKAPAIMIEPLVYLIIMAIAVENMMLKKPGVIRVPLVILAGLIHGAGNGKLNEIGLPPDKFMSSILAYNLGMLTAQVFTAVLVFSFLIIPFKRKSWYRSKLVYSVSAGITLLTFYWTISRIFFI